MHSQCCHIFTGPGGLLPATRETHKTGLSLFLSKIIYFCVCFRNHRRLILTAKKWSSRGFMTLPQASGHIPCQKTSRPTRPCWRDSPRCPSRARPSPSPPARCRPEYSPGPRCHPWCHPLTRCWPRYLSCPRSGPDYSASSFPPGKSLSPRNFHPPGFWETLTSTETARTRLLTVREIFCLYFTQMYFLFSFRFVILFVTSPQSILFHFYLILRDRMTISGLGIKLIPFQIKDCPWFPIFWHVIITAQTWKRPFPPFSFLVNFSIYR